MFLSFRYQVPGFLLIPASLALSTRSASLAARSAGWIESMFEFEGRAGEFFLRLSRNEQMATLRCHKLNDYSIHRGRSGRTDSFLFVQNAASRETDGAHVWLESYSALNGQLEWAWWSVPA